MTATFRVGTSGWHYDDWEGLFYPEELLRAEWLAFYADEFDTTEINNSFYQLPEPETWRSWRDAVPEGFVFSVKANRLITHRKKLIKGPGYLENFLDGASELGDRLGPILFQLPGGWHANVERLAEFVSRLPRDRRYVFEFRHESWLDERIGEVLRSANIGFCCYDMPDRDWPVRVTADFAYVRFHGAGTELYAGRYHKNTLKRWARILADIGADVEDVFVYFNNDRHGHAVENARTFRALLAEAS